MRCRVLWSGERDWGCGVVELVTHVHVTCTDSWSQGDGEVHAGLLFLYLSSSFLPYFLPSCARRTTPFSQIHVQYLT